MIDNLMVYAPFLSYSGYGTASRRFCYWLTTLTQDWLFQDISFALTEPPQMDHPDWSKNYCKPLIGGDPICMVWAIPTLFKNFQPPHAKLKIGSTCFEGDKITPEWAEGCNLMDMVLVPANKQAFIKGGVEEYKIVELPYLPDPAIFSGDIVPPSRLQPYTFVTIVDANTAYRKGFDLLIEAYYRNFTSKHKVLLRVKTNDKGKTIDQILSIYDKVKPLDKPNIEVIWRSLDDMGIQQFIAGGDCYITPFRGEGYNIPLYDAIIQHKPVMTTYDTSIPFIPANIHHETAQLKPIRMVPAYGDDLAYKNVKWLEVSVGDLGKQMKQCFLAPSDCRLSHTLGATVIDTKDKIQDYMQNLVEIIDYYADAKRVLV